LIDTSTQARLEAVTKRRDIEKRISQIGKAKGWTIRIVEGANHTKFWLGVHYLTVPRHREIPEYLGRAILHDLDQIDKGKR